MKARLFNIIVFATALLGTVGCQNQSLAPNGVYADKTLYDADLVIVQTYTTFDTFLKWELDNRAALEAVSPSIKKFADDVRANAPHWFSTAEALRDVYAANPTAANASALTSAIAIINTALAQAASYMAPPAPLTTTATSTK